MAEAYGKTPAEMLFAGSEGLSRMERYRLNEDVFNATRLFEKRHGGGNGGGVAGTEAGPGTATTGEKRQLIRRNEERARRRESMENSAKSATTPEGQLDQLDAVLAEREQDGQ